MKKNLRIVSAAAAALLAVAPVAATAVSTVSADAVNTATNIGTVPEVSNGSTVNVKPNISLNTSVTNNAITSVNAAVSASFDVTVDGTTATSTLNPGVSSLELKNSKGESITAANFNKEVNEAAAGDTFTVTLNGVGLNFGTKNANKEVTLHFPKGASATATVNGQSVSTDAKGDMKVTLNQNGVINLDKVTFTTVAKNFANPQVITWFSANTGAPVTSANFEMYAGSDAGKLNVSQVLNAIPVGTNKANGYFANQLDNQGKIKYSNNLKDALKAMGVEVDAQGWFVAPKSFTFNYTATSDMNDATATLPVTVTVPNGKDVTPATVESTSKTIMHASYYYNKEGKRVGTDKIGAYNTVTVVPTTVKLSDGKTYYQVVENGKAVDKYINAGNIEGTKRTLKHNAYVYKNNGKAKTHKVGKKTKKVLVKKGTEVTTYGAKFNINGKAYYRIGRNNEYVKVANF